jgi:hypothetical protein
MLVCGWLAVLLATGVGTFRLAVAGEFSREFGPSLAASAAAGAPAPVLAAEFMLWLTQPRFQRPDVYEFWGTALGLLWVLVGPMFLIGALALRPRVRHRWSVSLIQVGCFFTWALSSLVALMFAAEV